MESCGWSFHASDVSSPPSRGSDPAPLPPALGLEPLLPAGLEAAGVLSKAETLALWAPLFVHLLVLSPQSKRLKMYKRILYSSSGTPLVHSKTEII